MKDVKKHCFENNIVLSADFLALMIKSAYRQNIDMDRLNKIANTIHVMGIDLKKQVLNKGDINHIFVEELTEADLRMIEIVIPVLVLRPEDALDIINTNKRYEIEEVITLMIEEGL